MIGHWSIKCDHFWNKDEKITTILFLDVSYIDADGSYSKVYTPNKKYFVLSYNIGKVIKKMNTNDFSRSHESHYVGLRFVKNIIFKSGKNGGYFAELANGQLVKICEDLLPSLRDDWVAFRKRNNISDFDINK
jgi:DNA-binding LytR/AlgR family response regulator